MSAISTILRVVLLALAVGGCAEGTSRAPGQRDGSAPATRDGGQAGGANEVSFGDGHVSETHLYCAGGRLSATTGDAAPACSAAFSRELADLVATYPNTINLYHAAGTVLEQGALVADASQCSPGSKDANRNFEWYFSQGGLALCPADCAALSPADGGATSLSYLVGPHCRLCHAECI